MSPVYPLVGCRVSLRFCRGALIAKMRDTWPLDREQ